jgi:predicted outer membrane repeat protein
MKPEKIRRKTVMQNPSHEHIQHNALKPLQIQTSRVGRRLVTIQDKCVRVVLASIVLLALCSLVVQPMPTYAADYTADTFAELETAITNANNTSSDDTITLSADIALTGALPTIANNGSLTIDGDGHSIDGAGANRIFSIGNDASVTIKHMMLLNGYHLFKGGAINKETGSSLTIVNSSFMGNSTDDLGGAIYSNGGSLTIVNSIFSGNTASGGFIISGAAIASYGDTTLTIVNSTFNGNSSDDNSSTIENSGAAMHLYNTIVVGTTSGVNCGGDSPDTNINNWFDDSFCDGINSGDPGFEDADGADDILGAAGEPGQPGQRGARRRSQVAPHLQRGDGGRLLPQGAGGAG